LFTDQLRRAVEASPRAGLTHVSSLLWRAHAAGSVTEDEAQALAELIEARKAVPTPGKPTQRRVGSRPRTDDSMARRRSWAAGGRLPPHLAARFTLAEAAVLAVVASETAKRGDCRLHVEHIGALAGVARSTVKRALREAHALGLIRIEERRVSAWRNDSNIIRITSHEWLAWLRLRRRGVGSNPEPARIPDKKQGAASPQRAFEREAAVRFAPRDGGLRWGAAASRAE